MLAHGWCRGSYSVNASMLAKPSKQKSWWHLTSSPNSRAAIWFVSRRRLCVGNRTKTVTISTGGSSGRRSWNWKQYICWAKAQYLNRKLRLTPILQCKCPVWCYVLVSCKYSFYVMYLYYNGWKFWSILRLSFVGPNAGLRVLILHHHGHDNWAASARRVSWIIV